MHQALPAGASADPSARRLGRLLRLPLARALLVWSLGSTALAAGVGTYLAQLRAADLEDAFSHAEAEAAVAEQAVLRAMEGVASAHSLLGLWQSMHDGNWLAGMQAIEAHLRRMAAAGRLGIIQVGITGEDGRIAWSTAPGALGNNLSDREHVRVHLEEPGHPGLFLSGPVVGRATGRWSIQATKRHFRDEGLPSGVAIVSLDPIALSRELGDEGREPGQLVVVRHLSNGALLARSRDTERHLGRPPEPDHPAVVAARQHPSGRLRYNSRADGREVLVAYRVPAGLPVSVQAVHDLDAAMAGHRRIAAAIWAGLGAAILGGLAGALAWVRGRRLREALEAEATRDPLTGLLNRRSLRTQAEEALEAARRGEEGLAVILADMDHFKRINDQHGHEAGDTVLRDVGQALSAGVRREDLVCRWGGEELLVLLRDCPPETAALRAEALREAVASLYLGRRGPVPQVTISIGVACIPADAADLQDAVRRADAALYAAKAAGRNRIAVAGGLGKVEHAG
jgi:diguanylate cyclase (GGDEF)-like protein